jgi:adenosylhomocysteine nucleosidase
VAVINNGVLNTGNGNVTVSGAVMGSNNMVYSPSHAPSLDTPAPDHKLAERPIGVITVLPEETKAVLDLFDIGRPGPTIDAKTGVRYYEWTVHDVPVVVTRTAERANRSAVVAAQNLRAHCDPATVVLVGIAAGLRVDEPEYSLGDVVVATEILYYDDRKLESDGDHYRPHELRTHVAVRNAVNAFFTEYGEPFRLSAVTPGGRGRRSRVHFGKIASGEAVFARGYEGALEYIRRFDPKVLGVETEAGGVGQEFAEHPSSDRGPAGWLVVRGFSDDGMGRDEAHRATACKNAAAVLDLLLPYLQGQR